MDFQVTFQVHGYTFLFIMQSREIPKTLGNLKKLNFFVDGSTIYAKLFLVKFTHWYLIHSEKSASSLH